MADIPYVCLYTSYLEALSPFTDAEQGRLMTAMLQYAATGELPEFNGNERFIWPSLQAQIDRDAEKYRLRCEKNRENIAKRWKRKDDTTEYDGIIRITKNTKEKEKEKESIEADKPPTHSRFSPPSVDEVKSYCTEKGYSVDPQRFVDYYTSNGWRVGKNPMKDWKAAVRNWNGKEQPNGKTESKPTWTIGTVV